MASKNNLTNETIELLPSSSQPSRDESKSIPSGDRDWLTPKILVAKPMGWKHASLLSLLALSAAFLPNILWFVPESLPPDMPCSGSIEISGPAGEGTLQQIFDTVPLTAQSSFGVVKTIDVVWGIVIGRGGQALLLWLSYRVYQACLLRVMERTTVPYSLYLDMAMSQPSITSIWALTKFIFQRKQAGRHKVLMIWLISALIWVIVWQVFTDAMTSYTAIGEPYLRLEADYIIPYESAVQSPPAFIIGVYLEDKICDSHFIIMEDGTEQTQSVSLSDSEGIHANEAKVPFRNSTLYQSLESLFFGPLQLDDNGTESSDQLSQYVQGIDNFLALKVDLSFDLTSDLNKCSPEHSSDLSPFATLWFIVNDIAYPLSILSQNNEHMICASSDKNYTWGYAPNLLIPFTGLHGIWVLGTFITWIHTTRLRRSQLNRCGRSFGRYRAVMDISEAMQEELGPHTAAYSDKELESVLAKRPPVRYAIKTTDQRDDTGADILHLGVSSTAGDRDLNLQGGEVYG